MPADDLFPGRPEVRPSIYAYRDKNPDHAGFLKVGYTTRDVETRVSEQFGVVQPGAGKPYVIEFDGSAVRPDGSTFTDHDVHRRLEGNGHENVGGEWYRCSPADVRNAWLEVRDRRDYGARRTECFPMRPEQERAVEVTRAYFEECERSGGRMRPKFLWNAKMRFGKTFATYQLARRMGLKRVLILTFKPAAEAAWEEDLATHVDFEGWQFVKRGGMQYEDCDVHRPIVCFGSFQDYLGYERSTKRIKPRNEWVHLEDWDLVVFDEYHFGAWRDSAQKLFAQPDEEGDEEGERSGNELDETWLPIESRFYLYLSGTPFRALNSGEFIEEQVFSWTYSDEQRGKEEWTGPDNPYEALPRMVLMTYRVPDSITRIARRGENDEFDLNVFFSAGGDGEGARFVYEEHVQKWLDLIRGSSRETAVDDLRLGAERPPMPFSDMRLLPVLTHTLWYLPSVASCHAMANLLRARNNTFYHDYEVVVAAGPGAGMGAEAALPVRRAMGDPLATKTITLSCGKLTTGVTMRPWSGVLMLRNTSSPETYFQTAFRAQSPWTCTDDAGRTQVLKRECYVFDFALDRALSMVADYGCRLSVEETSPEKKVGDFIRFLPVLAYDGSGMRPVDAADILDIAMAGTDATLLARRWESPLLVNVDDDTLRRLLANEDAMRALMSIEGFRNLNSDIETIINKSEHVKKARREGGELTQEEKRQLSEEEKEFKSKRKQIQEKLIKFATRIPVFMYLTDFREQCLKDVITQLEPGLFRRVTGLTVRDFELLVSLGVFNDGLMNDAVYKFRRYEDASLGYTGIERHRYDRGVGLFDTELTRADYEEMRRRDTRLGGDGLALERGAAIPYRSVEVRRPKGGEGPARVAHGAGSIPVAEVRRQMGGEGAPGGDGAAEKDGLAGDDGPAEGPREGETPAQSPAPGSLKVGDTVWHKAFGKGTVRRIGGGSVLVYTGGKERKFLFPQAFEAGFLSMSEQPAR